MQALAFLYFSLLFSLRFFWVLLCVSDLLLLFSAFRFPAVPPLGGFERYLSYQTPLPTISWSWRQTFGVFLLFRSVILHLMGLTLGREISLMRRWLLHWVLHFCVFFYMFLQKIAEAVSSVKQLVASWIGCVRLVPRITLVTGLDGLSLIGFWLSYIYIWAGPIPWRRLLGILSSDCSPRGKLAPIPQKIYIYIYIYI